MHLWFLEWFPYAISHGINPFLTNIATFPNQVNLLWNNADLVLGLLAWPLVLFFGGSVAIGLVYVGLVAAAATAMAWQLRAHVRHASAAWVGGLLFGFSPFAQSELAAGHLTWMTTATLPLGWWIGSRAMRSVHQRRRRALWGVACGGWLVLQYWASKELLATSLLMAVILLLIFHARHAPAAWHWVRASVPLALGGVATAGALLAFPLVVQFTATVPLSRPTVLAPGSNVVDLLAFVAPGYSQLLTFGTVGLFAHRFAGVFLETDGYLGLPIVAVAVWAAFTRRGESLVRFGISCSAIGAVLALGPWLHVDGAALPVPLPWLLLGHLPFYAKAVPSRMTVFVVIGVACLLATAWDHVVDRLRSLARVTALGILFTPLLPSLGLLHGYAGFPMYPPAVLRSSALRALPRSAVIVTVPRSTRDNHGLTMYWQAQSSFRYAQPFGYLLHPGPRGVMTFFNAPSPLETLVTSLTLNRPVSAAVTPAALATQLRDWDVAAIIITPRRGFQGEVSVMARLLGAPPKMVAGSAVWFHPR
ncbi:MAG: hypothetical protein M0027_16975 [Candidatus Dormibacteraeota bacterium]|nr:hypothetical protein [Candidatus Dormibacteraeota bacterium]